MADKSLGFTLVRTSGDEVIPGSLLCKPLNFGDMDDGAAAFARNFPAITGSETFRLGEMTSEDVLPWVGEFRGLAL